MTELLVWQEYLHLSENLSRMTCTKRQAFHNVYCGIHEHASTPTIVFTVQRLLLKRMFNCCTLIAELDLFHMQTSSVVTQGINLYLL